MRSHLVITNLVLCETAAKELAAGRKFLAAGCLMSIRSANNGWPVTVLPRLEAAHILLTREEAGLSAPLAWGTPADIIASAVETLRGML